MNQSPYPLHPILVIDDEQGILLSIDTTLQLAGFSNVLTCGDSRQAMAIVHERSPAVILLDLNMPHIDGEAILDQIVTSRPDIPVIIITGRIDTDTAVECMKGGAFDYIVKPVDENRLLASVKKSLQFNELHQENRVLNEKLREGNLKHPEAFTGIITNSPRMILLFNYAESIAATAHPVLISGETGTGKELMAKAIHRLSGRKGAFIATNVAGLDDTIFADTLFGHVKGAYTGADLDRPGLVEQASEGTLFLDEIGDLTQSSQVKLLRLLQEREFMPLGRDEVRKSSARIIASTHVDLWQLQQQKRFRQDLHYRLRTHRIVLPPLRERREDLPALIDFFVEKSTTALGKTPSRIPGELLPLLQNYHFPGNIRELQSMVFDAVAQNGTPCLPLTVFREHIAQVYQAEGGRNSRNAGDSVPITFSDPLPTIKEATRMLVEEAMFRAGNNQSTAASMLGISQQALSKRLRGWEKES